MYRQIFARSRPLGLLSKAAIAFLLTLPTFPAAAQSEGSLSVGFGGGLHDADNALTIGDNEAQDALNVRLTKDGQGLRSREGISVNASLTVGTAPVVGDHYFKTAGGTTIRIVAHDRFVAASADGAAFSNIITTAPTNVSYWDFADSQGLVWGLSSTNTELFSYNGSAVTWYPSLPAGTQVEATPDRLIISGTSGNPNRVHYSAQGTFTNFTAGNDPNSPFTDDIGIAGDKITAIKYALGRLIYWTSGGMGACEGTDQFNMVCYDISKRVGTTEPMSLIYANGAVYFRAQDNHFYGYDGQSLTKLTREQGTWVAQLLNSTGKTNVQTSAADFNAGAQNAYATWNTTDTTGSIYPSTFGPTATSAADFITGKIVNLSTTVTSGSLLFQSIKDNFSDDDVGTAPQWRKYCGNSYHSNTISQASSMTVPACTLDASVSYAVVETTSTGARYNWQWDFFEDPDVGQTTAVQFLADGEGADAKGYSIKYSRTASYYTVTLGSSTTQYSGGSGACGGSKQYCVIGSSDIVNTGGWWHFYRVARTEAGAFTVFRDTISIITGTDDTITVSSRFKVVANATAGSSAMIDNIVTPSSGVYVTETYDISFTTPTWGMVTFSTSITGSGTITYATRVKATAGGTFDANVAATNGQVIASATKRYIVAVATVSSANSDEPVSIQSHTLTAATTGQFHSQCLTGSGITTFGVLSCAVTTSGGGTATFYSRSGASCPLSSTWGAQTNNANFSPSAADAFQWRLDSGLSHSTDAVRLDQCTVSYIESAVAATFGQVFDDDLYWSVVYSSGLKQNRVLYYDPTHGVMFPWDLRVSAMVDAGNTLYMGCSDCGKLYQFGGVHNDTGTAISSYYITKEFALGDISRVKALDSMTAILKKQGSGSMSLDYTVDGTTTTTKTITLTSSRPIIVSNFNASNTASGRVVRFKFYNTTVDVPWEAYGLNLSYHFLPWGPN